MNILEYAIAKKLAGGGGATINNQDKTITQNGTYTADEGYTGLGTVSVNVARDGQTDIEEQWKRAIEGDSSKPVTKLPEGLTKIGEYSFYYARNVEFESIPEGVTEIESFSFNGASPADSMTFPSSLDKMYEAFERNMSIKSVTFKGTPTLLHAYCFFDCKNLLTINVPWAEGEVSGAPWGATNATINYNYTGG